MERHVAALASHDQELSGRAEALLVRHYAQDCIEQVMPLLSDVHPMTRFRAVWVLANSKAPDVFERLLPMTSDPDPAVRYDAAVALGILGDPWAVAPLIRLMGTRDEHALDSAAAAGLCKLGMIAYDELVAVVQGGNHDARLAAIYVLGGIEDGRAKRTLLDLLDHPEEEMRAAAADALYTAGVS